MDFDINGEECPSGDECAFHFRNDEEQFDPEFEEGRMVSYVGDWVVITEENRDPKDQLKLSLMNLGMPIKGDRPARYETTVTHVGKGALADLYEQDDDTIRLATRYLVTHDSWKNFKEAHEMVIEAVMGGSITLDNAVF